MPRGRFRRPVIDLESHPFDLTVWQLSNLLRQQGYPAHTRTIHTWLKTGYLHGYHPPANREWRITYRAALVLLEKRKRRIAA